MKRLATFMFLLPLMFGYRVFEKGLIWDVDVNRPWVFVKICDPDTLMPDNLPSTDPLSRTNPTKRSIVQSLIDDVNNLDSTYLHLEIFPDNPSSPSSDSNYTADRASNRTIEICTGGGGTLGSAGHAKFKASGGKIVSCEIVMDKDIGGNAMDWMGTVAHEIGHCLGLEHPQELTHAIMSYYSSPDVIRFQNDDLAGIAAQYPLPGVDLEEKNNFGLSCGLRK